MKKRATTVLNGYKAILSGAILELFIYKGYQIPFSLVSSQHRAKRELIRRINSNAGQWYDESLKKFYLPLFLTLTFAENMTDVNQANLLFKDFIKRFSYHFMGSKKSILKYSCVIEFQERGAVHYHLVLYNVPFINNIHDQISNVWGHGFIFINAIKEVRNIGSYVTKYMTKDMRDERLKGRKSHFSSRGLLSSLKTTNDFSIVDWLSLLPPDSMITNFELDGMEYQRHSAVNSFLRMLNTSRIVKQSQLSDTQVSSLTSSRQLSLFP